MSSGSFKKYYLQIMFTKKSCVNTWDVGNNSSGDPFLSLSLCPFLLFLFIYFFCASLHEGTFKYNYL